MTWSRARQEADLHYRFLTGAAPAKKRILAGQELEWIQD